VVVIQLEDTMMMMMMMMIWSSRSRNPQMEILGCCIYLLKGSNVAITDDDLLCVVPLVETDADRVGEWMLLSFLGRNGVMLGFCYVRLNHVIRCHSRKERERERELEGGEEGEEEVVLGAGRWCLEATSEGAK